MESDDILRIVLPSVPIVIIMVVFYCIHLRKVARGRSLLAKAQSSLEYGNATDAVILLKQALWKANEKPELERSILAELGQAYQHRNVAFDPRDYLILVGQYELLAKKGTAKAIEELKKAQLLKKQLIDRMPDLA